MQNLSNYKNLSTAIRMVYFLLVASKTTDKNTSLKDATYFIESIYKLLKSITNEH